MTYLLPRTLVYWLIKSHCPTSCNLVINVPGPGEGSRGPEAPAFKEALPCQIWMVLGLLARYLCFLFQNKENYYFHIPKRFTGGWNSDWNYGPSAPLSSVVSRGASVAGLGQLYLPSTVVENSSLLDMRFGNKNSGNNTCIKGRVVFCHPSWYSSARQVLGCTEANGKVTV